MDIIEVEILQDGTIKSSTNKVSMPNHSNAENFFRMLTTLTGGAASRVLKVGASLTGALRKHTHDGHTHSH